MVNTVRKGVNKSKVAEIFGVTRKTVYYWWNKAKKARNFLFRNEIREYFPQKVTEQVEANILALRHLFKWGTARIQQALMNLPKFMRDVVKNLIQDFKISRQTINNVLKKHGLNGYKRQKKNWKFFRAKFVDELWQIDLKEFKFFGQKYYILVVIDDYSRFILMLKLFDHCPTTQELTSALEKVMKYRKITPKKILTDNGGQFKIQWEEWCKEIGSEAIFAHPYYPQDKGKVERSIRNISEEFVKLLKVFPQWFNKLREYRKWHNKDRYHRGICCKPAELYL